MGENTDALTSSNSEADGICSYVKSCWSGRLDYYMRPHIKRNLLTNKNNLNIYFKRLLYIDDFRSCEASFAVERGQVIC